MYVLEISVDKFRELTADPTVCRDLRHHRIYLTRRLLDYPAKHADLLRITAPSKLYAPAESAHNSTRSQQTEMPKVWLRIPKSAFSHHHNRRIERAGETVDEPRERMNSGFQPIKRLFKRHRSLAGGLR